MVLEGKEVSFAGPVDAKAAGIETVCQDLSLCPNVDLVASWCGGWRGSPGCASGR